MSYYERIALRVPGDAENLLDFSLCDYEVTWFLPNI